MKPDLKTLQWVQCFCGPEFYKNIVVVTTKWDRFTEDDFKELWEKGGGWKLWWRGSAGS